MSPQGLLLETHLWQPTFLPTCFLIFPCAPDGTRTRNQLFCVANFDKHFGRTKKVDYDSGYRQGTTSPQLFFGEFDLEGAPNSVFFAPKFATHHCISQYSSSAGQTRETGKVVV